MPHYTLDELAKHTQATLVGDPDYLITGVENLDVASASEAAFLENPRYEKQLATSQAGVVLIQPTINHLPGRNYLVTPSPSLAFQKIIELFLVTPPSGFKSIHPTAVVHPTARIEEGVTIGPYAVIDQHTHIGAHTQIGPHVFIGAKSILGSLCELYAHVVVREGCHIGNRVIIQPGAVIGSSGFGYFTDAQGKHTYLKQLGQVIIEDDVEIGANTTIDRARFKTTRIGKGTKIDNLVQIAHQVELGPDNLIVAQVGIAGSTKTGRNVVMGGQVGVVGHIEIGDQVILGARSGVTKSLSKPGVYLGEPAAPAREMAEWVVHSRSIGKWSKRIRELESKLAQLEERFPPVESDSLA